MDVDRHPIKDVENLRGEAWLSFSPDQPHQPANHSPGCHIPPVKPRRNAKTPREGAGPIHQSANDQKNEIVVKRTSPALTLGGPGALEPLSSALRAHTLLWFQRTQLPRLRQPGHPLPCWLHGFATRREAEELLKGKPPGCFLLRLSESKIGFVLSYSGKDRCRHFMVEEEKQEEEEEGGAEEKGGSYLITGEKSRHDSLQELISYYTQNPVGPFDETLTIPCSQYAAPASNPVHNDATPQYAAVRKVLKKSHSLPGTQSGEPVLTSRGEALSVANCMKPDAPPDRSVANCMKPDAPPDRSVANCMKPDAPPDLSVANCMKPDAPPDLSMVGARGADVQYASVNKPPRSQALPPGNTNPYVNVGSLSEQQGPSVPLVRQGSMGSPGHWKPEPLDTYEEPPHLIQRRRDSQEQIYDFYAMGRQRDVEGNAADSTHLYSKVNWRGSRDTPPAHRPSLPPRPPPTASHCPAQQETVAQRGTDTLMTSTSPSQRQPSTRRDPRSDIYEQIQERPAVSGFGPPLPPPNPKRKP